MMVVMMTLMKKREERARVEWVGQHLIIFVAHQKNIAICKLQTQDTVMTRP
jgi:hypothetical protein